MKHTEKYRQRAHALKLESGDLDQLFCEIIELIPPQWGAMKLLADEAGVTAQTLWNWAYGTTSNPYLRNIIKVAGALGYNVALVKQKGHKPVLRRVK